MSPSAPDQMPAAPISSDRGARRPWLPPAVVELPKLTDLTLTSPIGGVGGIGGGGSTVFGLLLAAGLLFGINACSDQNLNRPSAGSNFLPAATEAFTCRVTLATKSLDCASSGPQAAPGQVIIGGQGTHVGLRSSNASYNGTSHVFSADVSVQNESSIPMGTSDGTTKDSAGIKVFFVSGPNGDVGNVTVANGTGTGTFTTAGQSYFKYDTLLKSQQVSNTQNWQFQLDPATTSFTFSVLVAAQMPASGTILRWALEPNVNQINWEGVSGWGFTGLAVFGQNGEVFVQDSGVWHAYTDPLGSGPGGSSLNNQVVAAGRNDITFQNGSRFRHWDGISWRTLDSLPSSPGLMYGAGPTGGLGGIWGLGFRFYRFNGSSWISDTLPSGINLVNKVTASTTFGTDPVILSDQGHVWRQNSSTGVWTEIGPGGSGQTQGPGIIFGTDASNIWTLSTVNNSDPVIRYWNGSSWATQAVPSNGGIQGNDNGVPLGGFANSGTDAYIVKTDGVGHGHLWHWDGTSWTEIRTAPYAYSGIWARTSNDFFISEGGGRVEEYISGTWTFALDSATSVPVVWSGGNNDAYLVTNNGIIRRYNGIGWKSIAFTNSTITSLWASGPNDVWVVRSQPVLVHVDSTGAGGASNTGSSYAFYGVNGTSGHDIWAVGQYGQIYHNDSTGWTKFVDLEGITPYDLYAVWAANPNFAVAVGQSGYILKWNGSSWAKDTIIGALSYRSVWGTSPSDVWAVGDGGEIVHYDGTVWSTVSSGTGQNLLGVWASSANEAYAVGANKTVLMYNGSSWSPISVQSSGGSSYNAISGVPGGQALIAGDRVLRGTR